jgi:WD40 repeat protein
VIDAATGERVLRLEKYHDVKITPDERLAVALTNDALEFYELKTGRIVERKIIKDATNSLEISPDGKYIAVSHRTSEAYLKNDPQFSKNPKALKFNLKFKQLISVYNASDFSFVATVNDYYDNVYRLEWSADGKELYCLSIPYTKAATAVSGRQNFISVIDAVYFRSTRIVFPSDSNYEPAFRKSHDGKYMGVVSWGKFPELRIHNALTGR